MVLLKKDTMNRIISILVEYWDRMKVFVSAYYQVIVVITFHFENI
jgi:hypothetical protein